MTHTENTKETLLKEFNSYFGVTPDKRTYTPLDAHERNMWFLTALDTYAEARVREERTNTLKAIIETIEELRKHPLLTPKDTK